MTLFSFTSKSVRNAIAAVLIVAMLCAQWTGLVHSVVHANGMAATSLNWENTRIDIAFSAFVQDDHGAMPAEKAIDEQAGSVEDTHFCASFEAATVGSGIHSTPFQLLPLPSAKVLALWIAFASWQSSFTCHFSSRAPPRV